MKHAVLIAGTTRHSGNRVNSPEHLAWRRRTLHSRGIPSRKAFLGTVTIGVTPTARDDRQPNLAQFVSARFSSETE